MKSKFVVSILVFLIVGFKSQNLAYSAGGKYIGEDDLVYVFYNGTDYDAAQVIES